MAICILLPFHFTFLIILTLIAQGFRSADKQREVGRFARSQKTDLLFLEVNFRNIRDVNDFNDRFVFKVFSVLVSQEVKEWKW